MESHRIVIVVGGLKLATRLGDKFGGRQWAQGTLPMQLLRLSDFLQQRTRPCA